MRSTAFDVFISYSSKDKQVADAVKHGLHNAGIRCWMAPDDIEPGRDWAAEVADAIETCPILVLIWTKASMSSAEVPKELGLAMSSGSIVIPFRLENIEPHGSFKYHLTGRHWLDAYDKDLEEAVIQLTGLTRTNIDGLQSARNSGSVIVDTSSSVTGIAGDAFRALDSTSQFSVRREEPVTRAPNGNGEEPDYSPVNNTISAEYGSNGPSAESPLGITLTNRQDYESGALENTTESAAQEAGDYLSASNKEIDSTIPVADFAMSPGTTKACATENGQTLLTPDQNKPLKLDGAREEADPKAPCSEPGRLASIGELQQWAREVELIHFCIEALLPLLGETIYKQGYLSRKLLGARTTPSINELVTDVCTNLHLFYLQTSTLRIVCSLSVVEIDKVKEYIGSEQIRSGSRVIYERALQLLGLTATGDAEGLDIRDLEDSIHDIFVEDVNCCIESDNSSGGVRLRFIDPSSGEIISSASRNGILEERFPCVFARICANILEISTYLLPAVLATADRIAPSDPALRTVVAERIGAFASWCLDAPVESAGKAIGFGVGQQLGLALARVDEGAQAFVHIQHFIQTCAALMALMRAVRTAPALAVRAQLADQALGHDPDQR